MPLLLTSEKKWLPLSLIRKTREYSRLEMATFLCTFRADSIFGPACCGWECMPTHPLPLNLPPPLALHSLLHPLPSKTIARYSYLYSPSSLLSHQYPALKMKDQWESNINVWFPFMYSQKWNCAAFLFPKENYNVLSPKIYIFPGSVFLFCCSYFAMWTDPANI